LVVGRAKLSSNAAGNSSVGNTGFWSVPDEIELVCAPPVLCTTPVRGSGVADESADNELCVVVDDVDETVVNDGDFEPDGEVDADFEPDGEVDADDELDERLDGPLWPVDEEADEPDEPEDEELDDEPGSDGSARATPGMVATADPTPSATTSAPTRPT
jgi:hypothetical protein